MTRLLKLFLATLAAVSAGMALAAENRIITRLRAGVDPKVVAQRYGIILTDRTDPAPFVLFTTPNGVDPHTIQAQMIGDPDVIWAEDDGSVLMPEHSGAGKGRTIAVVGDRDDLYGYNGNVLGQIRWSQGLANSPGRPVRLAVLDTGLSPNQPELWTKVVASVNAIEPGQPAYDLPRNTDSNGNGQKDEGTGHGTMVAGIVDQIAPKVQLVIARVADSDGVSNAWSLIKGIAFSVVSGSEVLNVSLGAEDKIVALSDTLDWVEENGVLMVAAAGNNGKRMALSPGIISKVVCVTGVQPDDRKASFSNWEGKVDSSAPATGIRSFWWDGTLGEWSGTSFATPMVAATVADALRRRRPGVLLPDVLGDMVEASGDDIDNLNQQYKGEMGTRLNFARYDAMLPRSVVPRLISPGIRKRPR